MRKIVAFTMMALLAAPVVAAPEPEGTVAEEAFTPALQLSINNHIHEFTDFGGNDATASVNYVRDASDNPVLQFRFTTSDTVEYTMDGSNFYVSSNSVLFEGSTADGFETTLTVTDPTADRSPTLPDSDGIVNVSTSPVAAGGTLTVTQALHAGLQGCIALDTASGSTITLPAATGTGDRYCFIVTTVPTSNQHRLNVTGNDEFVGVVSMAQDGGDLSIAFEAADAGDNDQLNLNGSTTGGATMGEIVEIWDISTDNWAIRANLSGTGTEATPFATGQNS